MMGKEPKPTYDDQTWAVIVTLFLNGMLLLAAYESSNNSGLGIAGTISIVLMALLFLFAGDKESMRR